MRSPIAHGSNCQDPFPSPCPEPCTLAGKLATAELRKCGNSHIDKNVGVIPTFHLRLSLAPRHIPTVGSTTSRGPGLHDDRKRPRRKVLLTMIIFQTACRAPPAKFEASTNIGHHFRTALGSPVRSPVSYSSRLSSDNRTLRYPPPAKSSHFRAPMSCQSPSASSSIRALPCPPPDLAAVRGVAAELSSASRPPEQRSPTGAV